MGKKPQSHILERSEVFLTTGIFPPNLVVPLDLTFLESVNIVATVGFFTRNTPFSFPSPHQLLLQLVQTTLLLYMVCLSNSLSRPLPVSPHIPNGSRKYTTSHLSMPSVTAVVFVYVLHLGCFLNPS